MLYFHKELKEKLKSDYKIKKAVNEKKYFKIDKGLYSDSKEFDQMEYIARKYPNAILTGETAFYVWNLTDEIPDKFI